MHHNQHIGSSGEQIVVRYLLSIGYEIIATNVRIARDEIDIICFDPRENAYVFAEVKSRSTRKEGFDPQVNCTRKKRDNMRRSARRWMMKYRPDDTWRLDLVCVSEKTVIDHIEGTGSWDY